jgi:PAS domain S-box-containing protein
VASTGAHKGDMRLRITQGDPWAPTPSEDAPADTMLRLQALIDATVDAYYDWHVRTDVNEFSYQMDALLGLPPGGLPRTGEGWKERVHPDDLPPVEEALRRSLSDLIPLATEYRMRREDGSYIIVEDRAHVLTDEPNEAVHVVGTISDVTKERAALQALKDTERLYETLFSRSGNPALRIDGEGLIVDANDAALRLLSCSMEELQRSQVSDLVDGDWTDGAATLPLAAGTTIRLRTPQGPRHLLITSVPCEVTGEQHHFLLGTDITGLVALQRALEASGAELEKQAEALTDRNTALRVLMDQRDTDRHSLEDRLAANMRELVLPTLERLARSLTQRRESVQVEALYDTVLGITESIAHSDAPGVARGVHLTRRETEILSLIKAGKRTAEIAEALVLSTATVSFHRRNIRRKLGLSKHDVHLSTYLSTDTLSVVPVALPSESSVPLRES